MMGHRWVRALTSYEFTFEYQKGSDNAVTDVLSWVPVRHDKDTVRLLLEGAVTGTTEREEVFMSQPLWVEHDCLSEESQVCALKLAPMHVTNWAEVQAEDVLLAACQKWMQTRKHVPLQKRHALLRTCMGKHSESEEGKALFCIRNSFTMKKGMLYANTTPKGETEGLLAFVVPSAHWCAALNGMLWDAGHQSLQRTLALAQEHFWWPKMDDDCWALVRGCQSCKVFEGAVVKALLHPVQAYAPLELIHVNFNSIETTMELNQPPSVKNVLVLMDHFTRYAMAFIIKDQKARTIAQILYEQFISVFGVPAKLFSDQGTNFTSTLALWHSKCRTTAYHV